MARTLICMAIAVFFSVSALTEVAEASNCTYQKVCIIKNGQKHCGVRKRCRGLALPMFDLAMMRIRGPASNQ